jgi:uncharacterized membrane protein required for colicin V production
MILLDYILLGAILIMALLGLRKGFIESLGSVIGIIVAAIAASRFYSEAAGWLGGSNWANVIAFIFIFSLAIKIVSLLFWFVGKIFKIVTVLPFISSFERLLGFILGFAEGIFVLSIILYFSLKFPFSDWLMQQMLVSLVAKTLLTVGDIFIPLFPNALTALKSFM